MDRFSVAMLEKLDKKRNEGRSGWNRPEECALEELEAIFREVQYKGDPIDIANLAMMIWNRKNPLP